MSLDSDLSTLFTPHYTLAGVSDVLRLSTQQAAQHTRLAPWRLALPGLLHVWEAERRDRWFGRASRELSVPLTVACDLQLCRLYCL